MAGRTVIAIWWSLILLPATGLAMDPSDPRARYAPKPEWEARFQEVCSYDSYCLRVKPNTRDPEFPWAYPLPAIREALEQLAPTIRQAAELYGVDPRAIVASIICENSLNVTVEDKLQTMLVASRVLPDAELFGNGFTIGLGQLHCDRAEGVEAMAARMEGRAVRRGSDVCNALTKPGPTIYYVAALVREAQDIYAKAGHDISGKPEILATLYNLGQVKSRALAATVREPRVNFFGLFAEMYAPEIAEIAAFKPRSLQSEPGEPRVLGNDQTRTVVQGGRLFLRSRTPCDAVAGKIGTTDFGSTKVEAGDIAIDVLDETKCASQAWYLVRMASGKTGWVLATDLGTSVKVESVPQCVYSIAPECRDRADLFESEFGKSRGDRSSTGDLIAFDLPFSVDGASGGGGQSAAPRATLPFLDPATLPVMEAREAGRALSAREVRKAQERITNLPGVLTRDPAVTDWNDAKNPYRDIPIHGKWDCALDLCAKRRDVVCLPDDPKAVRYLSSVDVGRKESTAQAKKNRGLLNAVFGTAGPVFTAVRLEKPPAPGARARSFETILSACKAKGGSDAALLSGLEQLSTRVRVGSDSDLDCIAGVEESWAELARACGAPGAGTSSAPGAGVAAGGAAACVADPAASLPQVAGQEALTGVVEAACGEGEPAIQSALRAVEQAIEKRCGNTAGRCVYDSATMAERASLLAQDPCVATIYTGDPGLASAVTPATSKIVMRSDVATRMSNPPATSRSWSIGIKRTRDCTELLEQGSQTLRNSASTPDVREAEIQEMARRKLLDSDAAARFVVDERTTPEALVSLAKNAPVIATGGAGGTEALYAAIEAKLGDTPQGKLARVARLSNIADPSKLNASDLKTNAALLKTYLKDEGSTADLRAAAWTELGREWPAILAAGGLTRDEVIGMAEANVTKFQAHSSDASFGAMLRALDGVQNGQEKSARIGSLLLATLSISTVGPLTLAAADSLLDDVDIGSASAFFEKAIRAKGADAASLKSLIARMTKLTWTPARDGWSAVGTPALQPPEEQTALLTYLLLESPADVDTKTELLVALAQSKRGSGWIDSILPKMVSSPATSSTALETAGLFLVRAIGAGVAPAKTGEWLTRIVGSPKLSATGRARILHELGSAPFPSGSAAVDLVKIWDQSFAVAGKDPEVGRALAEQLQMLSGLASRERDRRLSALVSGLPISDPVAGALLIQGIFKAYPTDGERARALALASSQVPASAASGDRDAWFASMIETLRGPPAAAPSPGPSPVPPLGNPPRSHPLISATIQDPDIGASAVGELLRTTGVGPKSVAQAAAVLFESKSWTDRGSRLIAIAQDPRGDADTWLGIASYLPDEGLTLEENLKLVEILKSKTPDPSKQGVWIWGPMLERAEGPFLDECILRLLSDPAFVKAHATEFARMFKTIRTRITSKTPVIPPRFVGLGERFASAMAGVVALLSESKSGELDLLSQIAGWATLSPVPGEEVYLSPVIRALVRPAGDPNNLATHRKDSILIGMALLGRVPRLEGWQSIVASVLAETPNSARFALARFPITAGGGWIADAETDQIIASIVRADPAFCGYSDMQGCGALADEICSKTRSFLIADSTTVLQAVFETVLVSKEKKATVPNVRKTHWTQIIQNCRVNQVLTDAQAAPLFKLISESPFLDMAERRAGDQAFLALPAAARTGTPRKR